MQICIRELYNLQLPGVHVSSHPGSRKLLILFHDSLISSAGSCNNLQLPYFVAFVTFDRPVSVAPGVFYNFLVLPNG